MNATTNPALRIAFFISFGMLLLLLLGSLLFYKERMLFIDPCFVAFKIINTKSFVFSEHRYGAFITQIFPLMGTLLGLPLKAILILYSASFYIFYAVVAYFVGVRWKQYGLGIVLTFYFTLMVSDVYFWPNNEVHQGIAWMTLFLGLYFYKGQKGPVTYLILTFFLAFAISSHLLVLLPFAFFWLLLNVNVKFWETVPKRNLFLGYSILMLGLIGIKYWMSMDSWYDGQKLKGVHTLSLESVLGAFTSGHASSILDLVWFNYWLLIPIFLLGIGAMMQSKVYLDMVLLLGAMLAYFVLVCVTFPNAFDRDLLFYMESEWLGFAMISATGFVYYFLPRIKQARYVVIMLSLIFLVRIVYLYDSYLFFHQRLEKLQLATAYLQEQGKNKVLFPRNKELSDHYLMDWGLPVESIMLTQLEGRNPQATFKLVDENVEVRTGVDSFYTSFKYLPMSDLNPDYFHLDPQQEYLLLDEEVLLGILEKK